MPPHRHPVCAIVEEVVILHGHRVGIVIVAPDSAALIQERGIICLTGMARSSVIDLGFNIFVEKNGQ